MHCERSSILLKTCWPMKMFYLKKKKRTVVVAYFRLMIPVVENSTWSVVREAWRIGAVQDAGKALKEILLCSEDLWVLHIRAALDTLPLR